MKCVIVFCAVIAAVFAAEMYPSKYDNIDIDSILANKRLFDNYLQCLLKKGKCTEEGTVLRDLIPDALITGCSKCNEKQKVTIEKVCKFLVKERKESWDLLLKEYDPEGKYVEQYKKYLA